MAWNFNHLESVLESALLFGGSLCFVKKCISCITEDDQPTLA